MAWDGSMYSTLGFSELDLDLTTDNFGVSVRSDLYMECKGGVECEHGASGLELVGGVGGAHGGVLVSGKITVSGQNVGGSMTLRGVDTVEVTIMQGCTAWRLVGTDRAFDCQLP